MIADLSPGEARPITLSGWACRCARCGYEWTATTPEPPRACPPGAGRGCGSAYWRIPAGQLPRGRRPGTQAAAIKRRAADER